MAGIPCNSKALAYARDNGRTQTLAGDLRKRFPEDTIVQFNCLPTLHAKLAVGNGNGAEALEVLRAAVPYELGESTSGNYNGLPSTRFLWAARPLPLDTDPSCKSVNRKS